jgi:hypothetical protein
MGFLMSHKYYGLDEFLAEEFAHAKAQRRKAVK